MSPKKDRTEGASAERGAEPVAKDPAGIREMAKRLEIKIVDLKFVTCQGHGSISQFRLKI